MSKTDSASNPTGSETEITLGLLAAVEENSTVTQRSVAQELGIALGLANAYLKRCVKKGLIKVKQIPPNRYAYYVTPKGFTEKSRLTAEYLTSSFTFFRRARTQCEAVLRTCEANGWGRIALWGEGELAEIATLCARDFAVELVGIVSGADLDADSNGGAGTRFAGLPVAAELDALGPVDAVMVTDMQDPQAVVDGLLGRLADDRVLAPEVLRVKRRETGRRGGAREAGAGR